MAHGRRIVVIDDNRDSAETLAIILGLMGHEARIANDGPNGIDVISAFNPSAVILDIELPGMNGFEVADVLRSNPATAALKLIALTGRRNDLNQDSNGNAGFDHYIVKPADFSLLKKLLEDQPADYESS